MACCSTRRSSDEFVRFLSICVCFVVALSQESVCGSGPHTLHHTVLQVYLLPNTYVTLQSVPRPDSSTIKWFTPNRAPSLLTTRSTMKGNNLRIGPMKQDLNGLSVRYGYEIGNAHALQHMSNVASLYIAASTFDTVPFVGFEANQTVQVTSGSERRVFCFRLSASKQYTGSSLPPVTISLTKQARRHGSTTPFFREVPSSRYFHSRGCVRMRLLRPTDSGNYRVQLRSCLSTQSEEATIDFSLSVSVLTASTSQRTTSFQQTQFFVSTDATNLSRKIRQSTISTIPTTTPTSTRQLSCSSVSSIALEGSLHIYISVNTTLNITYKVHGGHRWKAKVYRNGQESGRAVVREKCIIVEKVQRSDSGLYQVIVRDGAKETMSNFTLVVGGEMIPTSTNTATTATQAEKPVVRSNTTTGVSIHHKNECKITMTMPTSTSSPKSVEDKVQTEDIQKWIIGIALSLALLVLLILMVCISYKRRLEIRLLFVRCRSRLGERQQTTSAYCNPSYATVLKPTAVHNGEREEINSGTFHASDRSADTKATYSIIQPAATDNTRNELPHVIAEARSQNSFSMVATKGETSGPSTATDTGNREKSTETIMPVYATVHKKKKLVQNTSHSIETVETVSPQPAPTVSNGHAESTTHMSISARASLTATYSDSAHDDVNNSSLNEKTSTQRLHEGDGRIQLRPSPYETSKPNDSSCTQGDSNAKANEEPNKKERDASKPSTVYAELSKPKPNRRKKPPAQPLDGHATKSATQDHRIQYADLDIAALCKKY